jgi:SAM-dependent methyltransferase
MKTIVERAMYSVSKKLTKDYSQYVIKLPPQSMRLMGSKFYSDDFYLKSSLAEGDRFVNKLHVNERTEILEIGCASGRSVIGLIERTGRVKRYLGLDANKRNVLWCNKHIASKYDFCSFQYIDMYHILFNPNGKIKVDDDYRIPLEDNSFDIVYLQSVLPNSIDTEVRIFAREYFRLLKPGGTLFLTSFIEENVPDMTENPEGYVMNCTYPRQIMRYEKSFFLKLFTDAGFVVDSYEQGNEVDSQSAVYLKKLL